MKRGKGRSTSPWFSESLGANPGAILSGHGHKNARRLDADVYARQVLEDAEIYEERNWQFDLYGAPGDFDE